MRSALFTSALALLAGNAFAEDDPLSWLTAEKCSRLVFPAVFPPSPAQQRCNSLRRRDVDPLDWLTREKCSRLAFPAVVPPSRAEQRCEQLRRRDLSLVEGMPGVARRDADGIDDLTAEKCSQLAFPAVFPPTPAQQRCDELLGSGSRFSERFPVTLDRRTPDEIDGLTAEQCRNSAFIDIYPPSPAEVRCNEILGKEEPLTRRDGLNALTAEKCSKMAFLDVFPPTEAEIRCTQLTGGVVKRVAEFKA